MMKNMIKAVAALATSAIFLTTLAACGSDKPTDDKATKDEPEKLSIVATIFPQYDFSRQIAGDLADVTMLVGPGEEAHTYEPTPQDILTIQNADIFIYCGGESESWVNGILGSFDTSSIQIIDMLDICDTVDEELAPGMEGYSSDSDERETHDAELGEPDEHVWASVDNAQVISQAIADALCEVDEDNSAVYRENCERYLSELSSLKKEIAQTVSSGERSTVIFGDRFPARYFTEEFGLTY